MKIRVWTLAYDKDDDGTGAEAFLTEKEADTAKINYIFAGWDEIGHEDEKEQREKALALLEDDPKDELPDLLEKNCGWPDTYSIDYHDLEIPADPLDALAHEIAEDSCKELIKSTSLSATDSTGAKWLDVSNPQDCEADGLLQAMQYLDLAGILKRSPENVSWVGWDEDDDEGTYTQEEIRTDLLLDTKTGTIKSTSML